MHATRGVRSGFPVHPQSFREYFSSSENSIVIETQGEQMEWLPVIQPQSAAGAKNISYKPTLRLIGTNPGPDEVPTSWLKMEKLVPDPACGHPKRKPVTSLLR
jgi:hypothetical protein